MSRQYRKGATWEGAAALGVLAYVLRDELRGLAAGPTGATGGIGGTGDTEPPGGGGGVIRRLSDLLGDFTLRKLEKGR